MFDTLRHEGHMLSILEERHYQAIIETHRHSSRLMRAFSPQRFDGDVLLFVATEEQEATPPIESWQPYVGGRIDVHRIACKHAALMDHAAAARIGRVLASELAKAAGSPQSPHQRSKT
jgi:nonribosomal peptide synthetase DhbF